MAMQRTGTKPTRMAAGDESPTAATRNPIVAASVYAGATLDVAITVVSNSVSVLVLSSDSTGFP